MIGRFLAWMDRHPQAWLVALAICVGAAIILVFSLADSSDDRSRRFIAACREAQFSKQQCAVLDAGRNAADE